LGYALKAVCSPNPEEAVKLTKESIRIEESHLSGRSDLDTLITYVNLSLKYLSIGDSLKAIKYADKIDIDSLGDERGMPDILANLYAVYSTARGKDDAKCKMCLMKGALIAERIEDMQNVVKTCSELAHIALNIEKDKAQAFGYCERAWAGATKDGLENVRDFGPLLGVCAAAWKCIPKRKGLLWTRRVKAVMDKILSIGFVNREVANLYLASAYTLQLRDPKESANKDWLAKCMETFGNDVKALTACMAEAALRSKTYS
jgi:hypothetical protein